MGLGYFVPAVHNYDNNKQTEKAHNTVAMSYDININNNKNNNKNNNLYYYSLDSSCRIPDILGVFAFFFLLPMSWEA